jgi:DNA-binding transcriptional MerR regulator
VLEPEVLGGLCEGSPASTEKQFERPDRRPREADIFRRTRATNGARSTTSTTVASSPSSISTRRSTGPGPSEMVSSRAAAARHGAPSGCRSLADARRRRAAGGALGEHTEEVPREAGWREEVAALEGGAVAGPSQEVLVRRPGCRRGRGHGPERGRRRTQPGGRGGKVHGMSAPAAELLKISELAERSGVPVATVRHYLREGLLPEPVKTSRNMAYYPPEFIQRIRLIKQLQEDRFMPLRVIRDLLERDDAEPERLRAMIELEDQILSRRSWASASGSRPRRSGAATRSPGGPHRLAELEVPSPDRSGYSPSDVRIVEAIAASGRRPRRAARVHCLRHAALQAGAGAAGRRGRWRCSRSGSPATSSRTGRWSSDRGRRPAAQRLRSAPHTKLGWSPQLERHRASRH